MKRNSIVSSSVQLLPSRSLQERKLLCILFPSELLLNYWALLIVNYTQQVPPISSTEENVHHMPDHKCVFPTGVTYLLSKKLFILLLMVLVPFFRIRYYLNAEMWETPAVVLRRFRIISNIGQFKRQIYSDIKTFNNKEKPQNILHQLTYKTSPIPHIPSGSVKGETSTKNKYENLCKCHSAINTVRPQVC